MEVMIALGMIAVLLSTLMMVQSKVFNNVISSTFKIERFYSIRNMFLLTKIKPLEGDQKSWTKTIEDPTTMLTYEKKSIKPESKLARFTGLFQEVATGSWHEWGRERAYDIINYQFDPPKKEKENESP